MCIRDSILLGPKTKIHIRDFYENEDDDTEVDRSSDEFMEEPLMWRPVSYTHLNQELHEAAIVDGASKLKRVLKIDLPMIIPTAAIILTLNVGNVMSLGFEKAYLMQNDLNMNVSEILSTYVYKKGLLDIDYSYSAAVGLFNNVINLILLVTVNQFAKKITKSSLW